MLKNSANYLSIQLSSEFQKKLLAACIRSLEETYNPLCLNNFCSGYRELVRHVLSDLAPDAEIKACNWYVPDTTSKTGITRAHAIIYVLQGGLSSDYVTEVLEIDIAQDTKQLISTINKLNKYTHVNQSTFGIDVSRASEEAALAIDSLSSVLRLANHCGVQLAQALEAQIHMMGHAERSFEVLEAHGLLPVLLPVLAKALCNDPHGQCRSMVRLALAMTDERVAADKPVTPAFLFAALLWPAYASELHHLLMSGADLAVAEQRAADRVTLRQTDRLAIPKRFTVPMHEIWWLQSRFPLRQRKRVLRLLHHPRFRAAFDFLELRAEAAPELTDEVAWWRDAQSVDVDALVERMQPKTGRSGSREAGSVSAPTGRRRKPRRRPAPPPA